MRLPAHEGQKPRFLQRPCVFARTLEGKQHLVRIRITIQTQEAVGQHATQQVGSECVTGLKQRNPWKSLGKLIIARALLEEEVHQFGRGAEWI